MQFVMNNAKKGKIIHYTLQEHDAMKMILMDVVKVNNHRLETLLTSPNKENFRDKISVCF